jgi:hypothetical protein
MRATWDGFTVSSRCLLAGEIHRLLQTGRMQARQQPVVKRCECTARTRRARRQCQPGPRRHHSLSRKITAASASIAAMFITGVMDFVMRNLVPGTGIISSGRGPVSSRPSAPRSLQPLGQDGVGAFAGPASRGPNDRFRLLDDMQFREDSGAWLPTLGPSIRSNAGSLAR